MPKINNIGCSAETKVKQASFRQIIRVHLKCYSAIIKRWKHLPNWCANYYTYIDLNGGDGTNPKTGEQGSPLIFANESLRYPNLKFRMRIYELKRNNLCKLMGRIGSVPKNVVVDWHGGDNKVRFPETFEGRRKKEFGVIYNDPNGLPDFGMLAEASFCFDKMDIFINCPCAIIKGVKAKKEAAPRLTDYLDMIKKRYWLLRGPVGRFEWTFLIGTNWDRFPEYKRIGFYRLDSEEGQKIFYELNYSKRERGVI